MSSHAQSPQCHSARSRRIHPTPCKYESLPKSRKIHWPVALQSAFSATGATWDLNETAAGDAYFHSKHIAAFGAFFAVAVGVAGANALAFRGAGLRPGHVAAGVARGAVVVGLAGLANLTVHGGHAVSGIAFQFATDGAGGTFAVSKARAGALLSRGTNGILPRDNAAHFVVAGAFAVSRTWQQAQALIRACPRRHTGQSAVQRATFPAYLAIGVHRTGLPVLTSATADTSESQLRYFTAHVAICLAFAVGADVFRA